MTQEIQLGAHVSLTTFMRMVGSWRRNLAQQLERLNKQEPAAAQLCASLTMAVSLLDDLHTQCEESPTWRLARVVDDDLRFIVHVAELTEVLHVLQALGVNPHTECLP